MAAITNPSYKRFKEAFLARELEAYFDYGEYQIRLIDAPEVSDKAASAVVLRRNMSPGFVSGLIERARGKDLVVESVFPSREDLLTNFQFLGMTIEEMWPELQPCFEI